MDVACDVVPLFWVGVCGGGGGGGGGGVVLFVKKFSVPDYFYFKKYVHYMQLWGGRDSWAGSWWN